MVWDLWSKSMSWEGFLQNFLMLFITQSTSFNCSSLSIQSMHNIGIWTNHCCLVVRLSWTTKIFQYLRSPPVMFPLWWAGQSRWRRNIKFKRVSCTCLRDWGSDQLLSWIVTTAFSSLLHISFIGLPESAAFSDMKCYSSTTFLLSCITIMVLSNITFPALSNEGRKASHNNF